MTSLVKPAIADEPDPGKEWTRPAELFMMPPGEWITVEGEKLRCYNQSEGVQIARLVNQQRDLFYAAIRWESERNAFEDKVGGLELRLQAQEGLVLEHKNNAEWYQGLWKSTRDELLRIDKYNRWRFVPWVLPALMGIAWGITSSVRK